MNVPSSGLAWPDHDTGPMPPPDNDAAARGEPPTRKPMALWDRTKFLLLFFILFWFFVWSDISDNPLLSVRDSVRDALDSKTWLFVLAGLELVRQVHYLISEHSAGWHQFWSSRVAGAWERRSARMDDWTRYRVARVAKLLFLLALASVVLGALFHVSPFTALFELPARFFVALPLLLQLAFSFVFVMLQFVGLFWFLSRGGVDVYFPDDIKTRFSDVWGQDPVLERVKENMVFLDSPEKIEEKGGYVPGGILLWGPPGTGKTLMAEAVAGETGKPFVFVDPGAFINMFFGVGILKVKSLFRKLRKLALRYGGVIVFFDEADSLGNRGMTVGAPGTMSPRELVPSGPGPWSSHGCNGMSYLSERTTAMLLADDRMSAMDGGDARGGRVNRIIAGMGMGGGGMGTLQALLTELSGLKKPRGFFNRVIRRTLGMRPKPPPKYRILVMMATNMPDVLDPALLRPGRIDRIYRVGYPSKEGRKRTYRGYLDKTRHVLTDEQIDKLAVITPYATGASIKDLVNEALIVAIRDGRDAITWADIVKAKLLKSLGPPEDVEYIERERHAVAIHEACHAVASYRLQDHLTIDIATIEKGQTFLGMVREIPLEEQFTSWRSEYEADIMVSIASLAGERMFFDGDSSSGVSADLRNATRVSMAMEAYWGMGPTVGSHAVTKAPVGAQPIDDGTDRNMLETVLGQQVEARLQDLLGRVTRLLEADRLAVLAVAHALEAYKTLTGDDVAAIIEGTDGPLVDGRVYHEPEFAELAEDYHALALTAHQQHGKVSVPLPQLNGKRPLQAVGVLAPPPPPPPPPPGAPPVYPPAPPTVPPS